MTHDNEQNIPSPNDPISPDPISMDRGRELLISRIIDGDASESDWTQFRDIASRDPEIWSDLSGAQRDHEALREAVRSATSGAARLEAPLTHAPHGAHQRRLDNAARWSGWGVAAMIAVVFFTRPSVNQPNQVLQTGSVGGVPSVTPLDQATSDQAFGRYIAAGREDGRVVGEMPEPIVVETRPTDAGTIEVILLRQIIERRELDRAYREVVDEFGNPSAVPVDLDNIARRRAY